MQSVNDSYAHKALLCSGKFFFFPDLAMECFRGHFGSKVASTPSRASSVPSLVTGSCSVTFYEYRQSLNDDIMRATYSFLWGFPCALFQC